MPQASSFPPARIEYLRVQNFRALRDVELKKLTPMTVLLGPNGSGKSTVFDVFAFLAECFESGLRRAWDKRGRARELKTRGADGPLVIEIKYRERPKSPLITYHLSVDESAGAPVVVHESLAWKRKSHGRPFRFLEHLRRPQFSWTRIKGESDVKGGGGHGWVEASAGSWVGADGGSPEGERSQRRRRGGWVGGLGARPAVEREPETGRGVAAAARRVA